MLRLNRINWWRVVIFAAIWAVITEVVHTVGAILAMPYYLMEEYFPVWSKVMMPAAGPPPASFYVYGIVYGLIAGFLFAVVYNIVKDSVPGKSAAKKGLAYGLMVFAVAGLPVAFTLHLLINLPCVLILAWAVESLVIYLVNGMIVAKLCK